MATPPEPRPILAKVVLLAGPSGCGKTHVALQSGLPVVALDDFYRGGAAPDLPRTDDGAVDWEDPDTWDADAAVQALDELCRSETVDVPTYSFGANAVVGHRTIERNGSPVVVAEGIFAAEIVAALRERDLLADALLVRQPRTVTFVRRLLRDIREARKSPWYLVRQGWTKTMAEPAVVARQRALGARPTTKATALRRLAELAGDGPPIASEPCPSP
ncbi:MAG: hypothetical protein KF906_06040 [Actinobacteria bacterium]|nr:hypothetical protein [Actinomycetota bacterium]